MKFAKKIFICVLSLTILFGVTGCSSQEKKEYTANLIEERLNQSYISLLYFAEVLKSK